MVSKILAGDQLLFKSGNRIMHIYSPEAGHADAVEFYLHRGRPIKTLRGFVKHCDRMADRNGLELDFVLYADDSTRAVFGIGVR